MHKKFVNMVLFVYLDNKIGIIECPIQEIDDLNEVKLVAQYKNDYGRHSFYSVNGNLYLACDEHVKTVISQADFFLDAKARNRALYEVGTVNITVNNNHTRDYDINFLSLASKSIILESTIAMRASNGALKNSYKKMLTLMKYQWGDKNMGIDLDYVTNNLYEAKKHLSNLIFYRGLILHPFKYPVFWMHKDVYDETYETYIDAFEMNSINFAPGQFLSHSDANGCFQFETGVQFLSGRVLEEAAAQKGTCNLQEVTIFDKSAFNHDVGKVLATKHKDVLLSFLLDNVKIAEESDDLLNRISIFKSNQENPLQDCYELQTMLTKNLGQHEKVILFCEKSAETLQEIERYVQNDCYHSASI